MVSSFLHPCCTYVARGRRGPVENPDRLSARVRADHPLSRVRSYLPLLERSFRLSPALRQVRHFTGPPRTPIRDHHYTFAYRALPQLFLSDPEDFFGGLEQAGEDFLEQIWKIVGDQMPQDAVLEPKGMALDFLGNDHEWRQENGKPSRVNNGDGPNTVEGFATAIQHKVSSPA